MSIGHICHVINAEKRNSLSAHFGEILRSFILRPSPDLPFLERSPPPQAHLWQQNRSTLGVRFDISPPHCELCQIYTNRSHFERERERMRISISYTCHAPLKDRKRKRQTLTFRDAAVTCRVTHAETIVAVSVATTAHSQKEGGSVRVSVCVLCVPIPASLPFPAHI